MAGVTAAEGKAVVGVGRGPAEAGAVVGVGRGLAQAVLAEAELAGAAASPDWAVAQPAMPASARAAMAAAAGTHVRYMYCLTRATGLWFRLALRRSSVLTIATAFTALQVRTKLS
jgi:hypothetical protein